MTVSDVPAGRFFARHFVVFVAEGGNRIVDNLACTVDAAERTMCGQAMPRCVGQVFAKDALCLAIELLLQYAYGRHLAEW